MKISAFKQLLSSLDSLTFRLENGLQIPSHFHITEAGVITKNYIDCGGVVRTEQIVTFQLWHANDFDHRLLPSKLLGIIRKAENIFDLGDSDVEIEFQGSTIGKYGLSFSNNQFVLTNKFTNCLAQDKCGIPAEALPTPVLAATSCKPGSGCC